MTRPVIGNCNGCGRRGVTGYWEKGPSSLVMDASETFMLVDGKWMRVLVNFGGGYYVCDDKCYNDARR